jgi:hypothetical protein
MLSLNDHLRLQAAAFAHLKSRFAELQASSLFLASDRTLHVTCSEQVEHDAISQKLEAIERRAYLSLGCCQVLVWVSVKDLD